MQNLQKVINSVPIMSIVSLAVALIALMFLNYNLADLQN